MFRISNAISTALEVWLFEDVAEKAALLELDSLLATLGSYGQLGENWDGYGAAPPKPATIRSACEIAEFLASWAPSPDPSPNPHGTISLEWENPVGYAYLEVGTKEFTALVRARGGTVCKIDRQPVGSAVALAWFAYELRAELFSQRNILGIDIPTELGRLGRLVLDPGAPQIDASVVSLVSVG